METLGEMKIESASVKDLAGVLMRRSLMTEHDAYYTVMGFGVSNLKVLIEFYVKHYGPIYVNCTIQDFSEMLRVLTGVTEQVAIYSVMELGAQNLKGMIDHFFEGRKND